jgi:DNA-binding transcriptional ArsR family regulator
MARPGNSDVFRAIADPTRRGLLTGLLPGESSVRALASEFELSLPAISQHLKVLKEVGLVDERRVGRERHYRVRAAGLREVAQWVSHFEQFWSGKLDALGRHLKEKP